MVSRQYMNYYSNSKTFRDLKANFNRTKRRTDLHSLCVKCMSIFHFTSLQNNAFCWKTDKHRILQNKFWNKDSSLFEKWIISNKIFSDNIAQPNITKQSILTLTHIGNIHLAFWTLYLFKCLFTYLHLSLSSFISIPLW